MGKALQDVEGAFLSVKSMHEIEASKKNLNTFAYICFLQIQKHYDSIN
jgi:hypothetical protein